MDTVLDTGTDKLLAHVEDGIGWITFNDPATRNSLSAEVRAALPRALRALAGDDAARVVVVTGAGGKAFVSGANIAEFGEQRTTPEARAAYDRASADTARAWSELEKPVIAMIRGYCIGGGLLMAMQADIRIASEDSQFGIPAARLGLGYGFGGVAALLELVGPALAAEMLYSARRLSAAEALHAGLVNRVVPSDQLEDQVRALARQIAANAPLTVRACKVALTEARREPERRDVDRVHELVEECFRSEDYLEGQRAFLEKRDPRFTGR
ncbi:MAG TPA: enoyl-CoA hydratase [Acidimicrobiales bacterium]|nr:enoyl-CoA hydratase [Acidimicrobiales bacterium]